VVAQLQAKLEQAQAEAAARGAAEAAQRDQINALESQQAAAEAARHALFAKLTMLQAQLVGTAAAESSVGESSSAGAGESAAGAGAGEGAAAAERNEADVAAAREKAELRRAQHKLAQKRRREKRLLAEQGRAKKKAAAAKDELTSVRIELEAARSAQDEAMAELRAELERDRAGLLEEMREQARYSKFLATVLGVLVRPTEMRRLQERARWDEEGDNGEGSWELPQIRPAKPFRRTQTFGDGSRIGGAELDADDDDNDPDLPDELLPQQHQQQQQQQQELDDSCEMSWSTRAAKEGAGAKLPLLFKSGSVAPMHWSEQPGAPVVLEPEETAALEAAWDDTEAAMDEAWDNL